MLLTGLLLVTLQVFFPFKVFVIIVTVLCVWVFRLHMYICVPHVCSACGARETVLNPLKLKVLGTEPSSSGRAASALAIEPHSRPRPVLLYNRDYLPRVGTVHSGHDPPMSITG